MVALQLIKNGVNILTMHKLFFVKMSSIFESMQICRLCLVKDQVNVLILAEKTLQKISTCLPIRITKDDQLPKKICETCLYKLDSQYEFWNTTVNAEKQLLSWLSHPETVPEHSIKQEIVDPLEDISENFLPENETPFEKSRSEFLPVENSYYDSIPPKKRKQQAVVKPVQFIALNESENNEKDVDPSCLVTTVLKTEKESENSEAEDIHENIDPINFVLSEIDDKVQPEVFVPQNIVEERPLKQSSKLVQIPSTGKCHLCAKIFHRRGHLKRHMLTHTEERPVSCDICLTRFKDKFAMKAHKKYHTDEKPFKCDTCDKTFKRKVSVEYHQRRHTKDYKIICEFCSTGFYTDAEYKLHLGSKHGQSNFICAICNKALYNKDGLIKHMRQHDDDYKDAKYKCHLCGKSFLQERYLKNHITNQHIDGLRRDYVCDLCGKKLSSGTSLRAHQLLHEGIKPNKCDTCGKCFNSRSNLVVHLRTHTGDRPYRCENCGKAFTQRNTYVIHMRYHTGERPYVCKVCDTGFVSKTTLNLHHKHKHNML